MFTNISVNMTKSKITRVSFDPPIPNVKFLELLQAHSLKSSAPQKDFSLFCSMIDENRNYSETETSVLLEEGLGVSKQKRSKFVSVIKSVESFFTQSKMMIAKTDEYVKEFDLWVEKTDHTEIKDEELKDLETHLCLRLYH